MSKPKVLHVATSYLPENKGFALRLAHLIEPLASDYEFHVLVPKRDRYGQPIYKGRISDCEVLNGIVVHRCEELTLHCMIDSIRRIHKQHAIDIVHAHFGRFVFASRLALPRKPLVFEVHAVPDVGLIKHFLLKLAFDLSERIIVLSLGAWGVLAEQYGVPSEKIVVIVNGVDAEWFQQGDSVSKWRVLGNADQGPTLGYIGTFYPWEGVDVLVKAFAVIAKRVQGATLVLVGTGPTIEQVKATVATLGLQNRVTFAGEVAYREVPSWLQKIDIFVIPRWRTLETETAIPLKLLEAMAAGKAIVATSVRGISEVIKDHVNGLLIPPGSPEALADAILTLVYDEELKVRLQTNAQRDAQEMRWSRSCAILNKIYGEMLSQKRGAE
jgi:glycosyltransferase involved in cell wall biosynthesis